MPIGIFALVAIRDRSLDPSNSVQHRVPYDDGQVLLFAYAHQALKWAQEFVEESGNAPHR